MKKILVMFFMAVMALSVNAQSNCPNANNPQHKCQHQVTATTHQCQNATANQQKPCADAAKCQHQCQGKANAQHQCQKANANCQQKCHGDAKCQKQCQNAQANQHKSCSNAANCEHKCQGNAQTKCSKATTYKVTDPVSTQTMSPEANKTKVEKVK